MTRDELIQAAKNARTRAHAPYSHYKVGAALLSTSDRTFVGCNVENASYGLTVCAERTAVFSAVAAGERTFKEIAIVTENGAAPCGACRQVLAEFAPDLVVHMADLRGKATTMTLRELLPLGFSSSQLPKGDD